MRLIFAMLLAATFVYGCKAETTEESGCTNDEQCKGDRICESGECVSPAVEASGAASTPTTEDVVLAPDTQPDQGEPDLIVQEKPGESDEADKLFAQLREILTDEGKTCGERLSVSHDFVVGLSQPVADRASPHVFELVDSFDAISTEECPVKIAAIGLALKIANSAEWDNTDTTWRMIVAGRLVDESKVGKSLPPEELEAALTALRSSKEQKSFELGALKVVIDRVKDGNSWPFDRYGDHWMEVQADKNSTYVFVDFTITSTDDDPKLPIMVAYEIVDGVPTQMGLLHV